ncbi:MAG: cobyric acid synthase CobQ, partial [Thiohalomonadales bacterium]
GVILGTYLHGLFDSESAITSILQWAGLDKPLESNYQDKCEDGINRLANIIDDCIDMKIIYSALKIKKTQHRFVNQ